MSRYGHTKVVDLPCERAIERVTEELAKEGFGVLTTIDVKATLKKKLDEDVPPYTILGACNPQIAHSAMQVEKNLGLLLPCNVVVYEDDQGQTVVGAVDAKAMLSVVGNPALDEAAAMVNERLQRVLERV